MNGCKNCGDQCQNKAGDGLCYVCRTFPPNTISRVKKNPIVLPCPKCLKLTERMDEIQKIADGLFDALVAEEDKVEELEKELAKAGDGLLLLAKSATDREDKLRGIYAGMQSNRTSYLQVMREIGEVV